ncbi:MAG TPA: hypothetical protein VFY10_13230 [Dehalococcoidia bacterium]|nr:hypothetical protein [Dehalococcoidia bacterium]
MKTIVKTLVIGVVAGGFGTLLLNIVTYLDMLLQGRPASSAPEELAGRLAEKAHIDRLASGNTAQEAQARRSATGALLGYSTGLGLAVGYSALRLTGLQPNALVSGIGLGLAAMASSDVPLTVTGVSNPKQWSLRSWVSDVVPHVAYGIATASAFQMLQPAVKSDRRPLRH